jgi:ubiquinone/menaquinone biosynthesis C-methylase UbiE/uncharacterized protein YbaR (Trm112 family)
MNTELARLLVCPRTGAALELFEFEGRDVASQDGTIYHDVRTGVLRSPDGDGYPVIDGLPRLVEGALFLFRARLDPHRRRLAALGLLSARALRPPPESFRRDFEPTLRRFEKEWLSHDTAGRTWGLNQEARVGKYLEYMGLDRAEHTGRFFLDLGAGTGQLTCTLCRVLGGVHVGLDLSAGPTQGEAAKSRWAGAAASRCHFVQANLMTPPLRPESFDFVHASGVLHHTPDTRAAFAAAARLVRPGGKLGVWLYRPSETWLPLLPLVRSRRLALRVSTLRRFTPRLPPASLYAALFLHAALFHACYKANEALRGRPHRQTVRERVTSLFDSLAPTYVHHHTPKEVRSWFTAAGFVDVVETDQENPAGFNLRGTRDRGRPPPRGDAASG